VPSRGRVARSSRDTRWLAGWGVPTRGGRARAARVARWEVGARAARPCAARPRRSAERRRAAPIHARQREGRRTLSRVEQGERRGAQYDDARVRPVRRTVRCDDGVAWLRGARLDPDHAVVTSLPDASELPALGLDGWRAWFEEVAALACVAAADPAVTIFYQTDVKRDGRWIDKGFLVQRAAERAGSTLLWHKVVCRVPPGATSFGRPAWAHLLCFSRALRLAPGQSSPDVLPRAGAMTWPRAMPVEACAAVARFLVAHTGCRTVVDPFCGLGTMLAVANAYGLDAVGVEQSPKRAERARGLIVEVDGG